MGLLDGKRLLITGVITDASLAFHAAKIAQEQGAQVVLTGFGRMRLVERIAQRLPAARAGRRAGRVRTRSSSTASPTGVGEHLGDDPGLDGVLHSIGFAPQTCLGEGAFLSAPWEDVAHDHPGQRVLAQVAGHGDAAAAGTGSVDRRDGLRQPAGLAGLRLDGRREVDAGVGDPLPGP